MLRALHKPGNGVCALLLIAVAWYQEGLGAPVISQDHLAEEGQQSKNDLDPYAYVIFFWITHGGVGINNDFVVYDPCNAFRKLFWL